MLFPVITIDLEVGDLLALANVDLATAKIFLNGLYNGQVYGYPKIMEICDRFDVKVTFFVSILEALRYGENLMRPICEDVLSKGHDLQIHTHPVWMFKDQRTAMWQCSFNEQVEVIETCKSIFTRWTGVEPIAHRAGSYSVNEDTFRALKRCGLKVDSSVFNGHSECKVQNTKNRVIELESIVELPVTVFDRIYNVTLGPLKIKRSQHRTKTDINWMKLVEIPQIINLFRDNGLKFINIFMHSFSFITWERNPFRLTGIDFNSMSKFEKLLNIISNMKGIQFITVSEFYEIYCQNSEQFVSPDNVPIIENNNPLSCRKIWNRIVGA